MTTDFKSLVLRTTTMLLEDQEGGNTEATVLSSGDLYEVKDYSTP